MLNTVRFTLQIFNRAFLSNIQECSFAENSRAITCFNSARKIWLFGLTLTIFFHYVFYFWKLPISYENCHCLSTVLVPEHTEKKNVTNRNLVGNHVGCQKEGSREKTWRIKNFTSCSWRCFGSSHSEEVWKIAHWLTVWFPRWWCARTHEIGVAGLCLVHTVTGCTLRSSLLRFSPSSQQPAARGMDLVIYPQALPPILTTLTFC